MAVVVAKESLQENRNYLFCLDYINDNIGLFKCLQQAYYY